MTDKLTAKHLENLRPPERGRIELTDSEQRGLKFRVTSNGIATWSLQMNANGRKRRYTIGNYPAIGLSDARKRAAKLRSQVYDGHDPIEVKREARRKAETELTVREAIDQHERLHLIPNLKTAAERRRQLDAALSQHLGSPLANLNRVDLQKIIDRKSETAPFAANRVRAALTSFIGWCYRRGYVEDNFALATRTETREVARERVLSVDEVRTIWQKTTQLGSLWAPFIQLLILTSQRRGDVAQMEWSEINLDENRWSIAGSKTKNGNPHIVHLSEPAIETLSSLQQVNSSDTGLVFTTTGNTPVSGFGRLKNRIDELTEVEDWRLHDLRTAFATHMADADVDESVVDRVLNHVASSSSASTVARVYNRAARLPARARALDMWANVVTSDA